ncbi:hypothetical protein I0C86_41710 [Plantactinospora sp. S1510]|uniref:HTH cro/C1-type domain-containing protein n=1 Tax=Plantactinospora alkalitolerans TaxID=2789879 RepID=A0ABS0HA69_9ACTN|nr:hypothetical protein [Plantactinospora alkalitolerans]MBF9135371.1 hypothetical protein [Plantactinospora alkalitolerans]
MVVPLLRLWRSTGWTAKAWAVRAGVGQMTVSALVRGTKASRVTSVAALAGALDAQYVVAPKDLTDRGHVEFLIEQLGLPADRAARVRECLLSAPSSPRPVPDGVRVSRSFVD